MEQLQTITVNVDELQDLAPQFDPFYTALLDLMQIQGHKQIAKEEKLAKAIAKEQARLTKSQSQQITGANPPSTSSISTRTKRPRPHPVSTDGPSKRTRSKANSPAHSDEQPTTPNQPIPPANPKSTSSSVSPKTRKPPRNY